MSMLLDVKGLRVEYGKFVAVSSLDLQLSAGSMLGLIGPNGAGKTTTLKAIAGLLPAAAGSVRVFDRAVEVLKPETRAPIGFAPDTPPIYENLSVADFLCFIGRAYGLPTSTIDERIDFWLEQLWLSDRRDAKIKSLSRGMRQRLTIARTLLPDPTLVLLDEPAAGLDPAGRVQFRKLLASLRDQGRALIVSSHILADLHEYCTHIGIMQGGNLIQCGTVAQVVGGSQDNHSRYEMTLARVVSDLAQVLSEFPMMQKLEIHGREVSFMFEHDDEAAAGLLKTLMERGLPIASFAPVAHDLEEAYLRTGIRQVD